MEHPANDRASIDLDEVLRLGLEDHQAGRVDRAEARYLQILEAEPDHAAANHYLGIAAHQAGRINRAVQLISKAVQADPTVAKYHGNLGLVLQAQGRLDEAVACYQDALGIDPDHVETHYNLGTARQLQERADEAAESYRRAIELRPEFADAHANLGGILLQRGRLADAAACYENALRIAPDFVEVRNCLGKVFHRQGRWDDAIGCFQQVIRANPEYPDAHVELGRILSERGRTGDALACFEAALKIDPGHVEALNFAGSAQLRLGRLENAKSSFRKAIDADPDNAVARNNLGAVLNERGRADAAIPLFLKAIELDPSLREPWENLKFALKAKNACESFVGDFGEPAQSSTNRQLFRYSLESFWPHRADESFDRALDSLPPMDLGPVSADGPSLEPDARGLPERMVALFHSGRSGTGLLHSLVDGHPQISTLPGVCLKGYFNDGVWKNLTAGGLDLLPERFAEVFEVLFDAFSRKPIPGHREEDNTDKGVTEGMTVVGEGRGESLSLDRELFCAEARKLMNGLGTIDPGLFLLIVHRAFDKVLGTTAVKPLAFYHIHDPVDFARLNFLRHFPDAKLVMMVREPIQNCESWTREAFEGDPRYSLIADRISALLFDFDRVEFRRRDSVGVRLEDLKRRPGETLRALAAWMGVDDDPALYRMTMQGKKWWGDPSSPDYDETKAMEPFDTAPIDRPAGLVFNERDRFVLATLFYPFSVRFGYLDPDPAAFEKDLKAVRPMLDGMFDFERDLAARASLAPTEFMRRGRFRFFHRSLIDRWEVLDEYGDYPGMLCPLGIG